MRTRSIRSPLACALLPFIVGAALGGCTSFNLFGDPPCGPDCGTNAATVGDKIFFHDLDGIADRDQRERNAAGVRVEEFLAPDGTPLELIVDGDQLRGRPLVPGGDPPLEGEALVGAVLVVSQEDAEGKVKRFRVEVKRTITTTFWSEPRDPLLAYELWYRPESTPGAREQPVCACEINEAEGWNEIRNAAIVFRGDRYDDAAVTVSAESRWFNIGCAGTAVAKMHLMRQTQAASRADLGPAPSMDQRNAVLKMLAADYCGTGTAFAKDSDAIHHADDVSSYATIADGDTMEAVWGPGGALCLDAPRKASRDKVLAECRRVDHALPSCAQWDADHDDRVEAFVRSTNPPRSR